MCLSHELLTMPLYKFALPAVDHHGKERGHKCISWKSWPRCSVGVNEKHLVLGKWFYSQELALELSRTEKAETTKNETQLLCFSLA